MIRSRPTNLPTSLQTNLQEQLDAITAKTRGLVQADRLAVSEQAVAELFASGIEERILQPGTRAPEFRLADAASRKQVSSADLLALGPLIISFFRGRWCPYCVTELETWRELAPELRRRGALFLAISPQTARQSNFMIEQHALTFPVLTDPGAAIAEKFGVAYSISQAQRRYYQSILINIPFNNAGLSYHNATEASWRLPLPATFLVHQDGVIAYSQAHADFRVRPEPAEILAFL
jgi:peroxiredoxin